ncbi:MAG: hypothetical protein JXA54_04640 [Candidatus Heimdallarchaeota archaeon]|nr:hypothetical protein [Candidatus Heimdallarchaeota archaeon]
MNPKKSLEKDSQEKTNQVYVLDASAIYNGILEHNLQGIKYVPECVISEIQGVLRGEAIIEEVQLYEDLKIISPEIPFIKESKQYAQETGDIQELSDCDLTVIAIALSLKSKNSKACIISDDYDIQNLANHLGLKFRGVHWKGITSKHEYIWVCPGCGFKSKKSYNECTECGTPMKKKAQKHALSKKGG